MTDAGHRARQRLLRRAFSRFSGRPQAEPSSRWTRWWPLGIAGALALVLSLLITLWLANPAKPPGPAAKSMTQFLP